MKRNRTHRMTSWSCVVAASLCSLVIACKGDDGEPGADCTAEDKGDGTYLLTCGSKKVTISDGEPGGSCSVSDDGAGKKTISCADGTVVTVSDGTDVDPDTLDGITEQLAELSKTAPESCATCHGGAGAKHQAVYDQYTDASKLELKITKLASAANPACTKDSDCSDGSCDSSVCAGEFGVTMTFTIEKNGVPYVDGSGLPSLDQKRFYAVRYDSGTKQFLQSVSFGNITPTGTPGQYTATAIAPYNTATASGTAYGYIASEQLDVGSSYQMYNDVSNAALVFGSVDYASAANVKGCEKCHGAPYQKHGYRAAKVAGLADFAACKTCHYDNRNGGHKDWQILVDDPARYAELSNAAAVCAAANDRTCDSIGENLTDEENSKYAYTANVMNDVHMAHAMEFAYPQSMANCVTCHEDRLAAIQNEANFTRQTCRSCHALEGSAAYGTNILSMQSIWQRKGVDSFHDINWFTTPGANECTSCHMGSGSATTRMKDLHNGGYNPTIYTADGTKYSELFTVSIDAASFNETSKVLTVTFSASEKEGSTVELNADNIVPTLMIGLYGWDTKHYIVGPHERDAENNRLLEFAIDGKTTNPRFTVGQAEGGTWSVSADLSQWAEMLGDGTVKRAEIAVMPQLVLVVDDADADVGSCTPECEGATHCAASNTCVANDDMMLALNAPSRTFDFATNGFDDGYFTDIVDVGRCNACHEALATTFHSPNRGGNIRVCRMCHITKNGGSHLEMQSRSIDSYVHAIHAFQPFDTDDINFSDPVQKLRYGHHTESTFPNFTLKNCESCHVPGSYEVPDQSQSMPGILSASAEWSSCTDAKDCERSIPTVPSLITGPATRACGGCHRAELINEDDANGLVAFNQHTKNNGYMVEDKQLADGTSVFDAVVKAIMSLFE